MLAAKRATRDVAADAAQDDGEPVQRQAVGELRDHQPGKRGLGKEAP
jgi:hypothetical protein